MEGFFGNCFNMILLMLCFTNLSIAFAQSHMNGFGEQPLAKIAIHKTVLALHSSASIIAVPFVLGTKGEDTQWVTVELESPIPSVDDWVGVFSPANFNSATCPDTDGIGWVEEPYICTAPIKYKYANYSNRNYAKTGKAILKFQLINQRADFSFALFSGGLSDPRLVAISNSISFANPKAPVYPRLALGKSWDEMTVTWTSGYDINEAVPFVEWGPKGGKKTRSHAGTLTFNRNSMCGEPARTVGWRDPGFIHTSFLKELWPNFRYTYKLGHMLSNGSYVWSKKYSFKASPYPGQNSLQRVIIFGDMGKAERDGSNEYADYQPGSLNTTDQLVKDLENYDIVFHIGDMPYANGYISQWDQFTAQVQEISSTVPYMIASGNHERDWPNTGSFYDTPDSGGECGVPAETMYKADYGLFRFCIADSEHDWREGSEQYKFIEHCLATVDRKHQPWLIFSAHRPLGYSSNLWYGMEGSFEEPMGRESLQKLWQKYKVDIGFYGHVHNYERVCPIYQNQCVNEEKHHYSGTVNGTIHVVVGGGGSHLSDFTPSPPIWSLYRDVDYGFGKLTAFNHSYLLFEYKKSSDGEVYDSFTISRDYRDVNLQERTLGWRDPNFIHTSFLKELWQNLRLIYNGHIFNDHTLFVVLKGFVLLLFSGTLTGWSKKYSFKASPYPGQNSLQRVIIFGDTGKVERDGSNGYAVINMETCLTQMDISQWDHFTAQVQEISSTVPYMIASGNHERDWPNTGSFFDTPDSGAECGVPAETMYYFPAENRAKFWYKADYGLFRFCIADSEHDWRKGSKQYKFIEHGLATVDRKHQP
ncbi:putative inactive purple acid phosphatase 27 [Glycine soja]